MPLNDPPVVYWDTNVFIAFMKKEPSRLYEIDYLVEKTENKELIIVTSPFTFTEAYKANDKECHEYFKEVLKFWSSEYRFTVDMDRYIGTITQELQNTKKLTWKDSIHVATALYKKVDYMLTYDGEDPNHKSSMLALHNELSFIGNGTQKLQIITPKMFIASSLFCVGRR